VGKSRYGRSLYHQTTTIEAISGLLVPTVRVAGSTTSGSIERERLVEP
jgi:hypothetical protein